MSRVNRRIDSKGSDKKVEKTKEASLPPSDAKELELILDRLWEINPLLSLTCSMSALSGLRYSDCSWLRYDDFFTAGGRSKPHFDLIQQKPYRMRIANGVETAEAERKSKVRIYVNQEMLEIVEETRFHSKSEDFLFANGRSALRESDGTIIHRPMAVESAAAHLAKVGKELDLSYTLGTHSFRKYFVRLLIQQGATIEKIKDLLGQSSLQSTNHYLHTFDNELAPIIEKISLS